MRTLNLIGLNAEIIRFQEFRVTRLSKSDKSARMRFVIPANCLHQAGVVAAGKVHHGMEVLSVHYRKQLVWGAEIFSVGRKLDAVLRLGRNRDMGVNIDGRKASSLDACLMYLKHALWFVIGQCQALTGGGRLLSCRFVSTSGFRSG